MIDIQKLKQFPLGYRMLEKYSDKRFGTILAMFTDKLTNEELVCFLDEQSIFIDINPVGHSDFQIKYFEYCVLGLCNYTGRFITRTEATEHAIIKAFELLETKLSIN